ncbi:short chain dehydrogenase [Xylariales sp. AK1849]|nr:short chain dehydrogenase [Xylariales sp. AK1849]
MSSLSVAGKYAIITGGGSGINLAFARLLLSRGCSVLIGDLNLRPEAQQLLSEYPYQSPSSSSSKKPSALFHPTDVRSWPQLSALFTKGLTSFPQIDIICPGAGLFEPAFSNFWHAPKTSSNPDTPSRDVVDKEISTYATLDVNLTHPIRMSQLGIGYWTQKRMPGCLVHVGSVAGHMASIGTPIYYASKHGLHGFVRALGSLRDELGIRVGAIAPGAVRTPMWSEDPLKAAMSDGGNGISMMPEQVAEGMLELCENPEYGNGTILEVSVTKTRVVPLYRAEPPSGGGTPMLGYVKAEQELLQSIKDNGLST